MGEWVEYDKWVAAYNKYIQSDAWRAVRDRYWSSQLPKDCYVCRKPRSPGMHLHHRTYARLFNERLTDLVPLCAGCHAAVHVAYDERLKRKTLLSTVTRQVRNEYELDHALPLSRRRNTCRVCKRLCAAGDRCVRDRLREGKAVHYECANLTLKSKQKKSR